ncbi:MAG: acyl carrier protein [Bacteroidales bacterium]|nr:acyl carrier protein [Bacteroidales bacterium]
MDKNTIQEQVIKTIYNLLENNNLKIDSKTNSEDIAEWSSLKHILILNEIENIFKINFDFEDILELTTVEEITNKISELKNENN